MNNTIKFSVNIKNTGKRLDIFLSENIKNLTRSFIKKLIENNHVDLNGVTISSPSTKVKIKDQIKVNIVEKNLDDVIPKKLN